MMNRNLVGMLTILMVVFFAGIGPSMAAENPCYTQIKLVNQDPNPAVPGSYVKMLFEVSGVENPTCDGFAIKLDPTYPFSLDPDVDPIQTLDGSTYVQDYKTTWVVPYKVRVADNALEGDYLIKLLYHSGSGRDFDTSYTSKTFNISIVDAQTDFDVVVQEASGTQVSLGVVNTGKNTANSLIVKIPKQQGFRTSGISEQIVGNLVAGDYTIVSFTVAQVPTNRTRDAQVDQSMLQVQIDYTDGIGKRRSVTKEVEFSTSFAQGNFTSGATNIQGNRFDTGSTTSPWAYVVGVAIVAVIGLVVYRKYRKSRKKDSKGSPDWVSMERDKHKSK